MKDYDVNIFFNMVIVLCHLDLAVHRVCFVGIISYILLIYNPLTTA